MQGDILNLFDYLMMLILVAGAVRSIRYILVSNDASQAAAGGIALPLNILTAYGYWAGWGAV